MKMTVTMLGHLQAYQASGATLDEFLKDHAVPQEMHAEAKMFWDDIAADKAANPGLAMVVPSD